MELLLYNSSMMVSRQTNRWIGKSAGGIWVYVYQLERLDIINLSITVQDYHVRYTNKIIDLYLLNADFVLNLQITWD